MSDKKSLIPITNMLSVSEDGFLEVHLGLFEGLRFVGNGSTFPISFQNASAEISASKDIVIKSGIENGGKIHLNPHDTGSDMSDEFTGDTIDVMGSNEMNSDVSYHVSESEIQMLYTFVSTFPSVVKSGATNLVTGHNTVSNDGKFIIDTLKSINNHFSK